MMRFLIFFVLGLMMTLVNGQAFNVNSPNIDTHWHTCTTQPVTWDGSGYPHLEKVHVMIYGGVKTQIYLGTFENRYGYAQLNVPKNLASGLYRARVWGYVYDSHGQLELVSDQSNWFPITKANFPCYY